MQNEQDMLRTIEEALVRCPLGKEPGRYAVYVPHSVIIGVYSERKTAEEIASHWRVMIPGAPFLVIDRCAVVVVLVSNAPFFSPRATSHGNRCRRASTRWSPKLTASTH